MDGLVSSARGDDPEFAESEMRIGITTLDAFGAVGYCAQAQEELARWLVEQHRPEDAQPFIDAARATCTDIAATARLVRLDAWDTSRQLFRTPCHPPVQDAPSAGITCDTGTFRGILVA